MPYTRSKNKNQTTKSIKQTGLKAALKQTKLMKARLMIISLKVDNYIYKKKPISTLEADTYSRELDAYRKQCSDERYLQVIEKLASYMKCLIEEQSQKYVSDTIPNTIKEFNTEYVQDNYNAIVDIEMEKALSNLSIADLKDPLDITDNNDNECYQKKFKIVNSTSTVTKENLYENNNTTAENNSNEVDISKLKVIDRKQIEIADDINENSQNILSNFEYKKYINQDTLRNYRKINNIQMQETIEDTTDKTDVYDSKKKENDTKKSESSNLNDKDQKNKEADLDNILSENLLDNFEYGNFSAVAAHQNNLNPINYQPRNDTEVANIIADTRNIVNYYNNINSENRRTELIQPRNDTEVANIIADTRNIVNYYNNINSENRRTELIVNNVNVIKEKIGDSNKLSQNLLINFESKNYATVGTLQNNTNSKNYESQQNIDSYCTSKDTFSKTNQIQLQLAQSKLTTFMSSNLKRNTQRKNPKKDIAKTQIKRKNNRKNKVNNVDVTTEQKDISKQTVNNYFHVAKNPENLVNNSAKKNKSRSLKKKREVIDMSWVENVKFVRVIEREEYIKVDDLEESFWSDLTLPSNISLDDFEYDNINIWKN